MKLMRAAMMATFASLRVGGVAEYQTRRGPRLMRKESSFSFTSHRPDLKYLISEIILNGAPKPAAYFTADEPLTKRQRRRQRRRSS